MTSIEWTDWAANPIRFGRGHYCQKVSPGCTNCYASRLQPRFGNPEFGGTGGAVPLTLTNGVTDGSMIWFDESKLRQVLKLQKPRRIFWCDMTDLFGVWVPDEWIDRCFAVMALTPQHTHQVLTKRPERMAAYMTWQNPLGTLDRSAKWYNAAGHRRRGATFFMPKVPLPNVHLGVSVEDRLRKDRMDELRRTPAAVRFLSLEPLLEDLGELDLAGIHWTIVGGESGPSARPCDLAWLRSAVRQCREADVKVFVKQLGTRPVINTSPNPNLMTGVGPHDGEDFPRCWRCGHFDFGPCGDGSLLCNGCNACWDRLRDPKGGDINEWPTDLRVREYPDAR